MSDPRIAQASSELAHPHLQRPMRRRVREITDPEQIEKLLQQEKIMHLAMSQNDKPFLVPVYFAWDGEALYFHSASAGSKIEILRSNPHVCFEISSVAGFIEAPLACDFEARHRTLIGFGQVSFIEDPLQKARALKLIVARFTDRQFEFPEENLAKTLVIRIQIQGIKGKQHGY